MESLRIYPVIFREYLRADTLQIYKYLKNLPELTQLTEIVMERIEKADRRYQVYRRNRRSGFPATKRHGAAAHRGQIHNTAEQQKPKRIY